jgi:hypothetical protein
MDVQAKAGVHRKGRQGRRGRMVTSQVTGFFKLQLTITYIFKFFFEAFGFLAYLNRRLCNANNQILAKLRRNLSNRIQISGVSGDQW